MCHNKGSGGSMKYKIVFVDIDDTLVLLDQAVGKKTKEVMTKLKDKGIMVVVDTGRHLSYAIEKSKEANLSNYVISSNGSEIYDYNKKEIIRTCNLPKKIVKEIYLYAKEHEMEIYLNTIEKRFATLPGENITSIENIDTILEKEQINQIVITSTNYERMITIPNLFKEKFPSIHIVHSSSELVERKRGKNIEYYHDIVFNHITKATGIVELLDYLKIKKEEAIAIGNGYDDIPMIDVVEKSFAVSNACDTLKRSVERIIPSAREEGVAKLLEELLLKEEKE